MESTHSGYQGQEVAHEINFNEISLDQGYSGSQENAVSLEMSEEDEILSQYFTKDTCNNLSDCSFHVMCAQASGYPSESRSMLFEDIE